MIVVGDIHAKDKEPYRKAIRDFFIWLKEKYSGQTIVFLGDLFDSASPHNEIRWEITQYLKQFKKVVILTGNHDYSKRMGNALLPLSHFANITVISNKTELVIEESNCLFLPFKYTNMKEEYESLGGIYDFVFSHLSPKEVQFGDEGIELNLDTRLYIHGHTHIQKDFENKNGTHHILGVPVATRHLEDQKYRIMEIEDTQHYKFIDVPIFLEFETVKYGEEPKKSNSIINVVDAPDITSVYERYKEFNIRKDGIQIKKEEGKKEENYEFKIGSIEDAFVKRADEISLEPAIKDCGLRYLGGVKK